jgi:hypothetical protein
MSNTGSWRTSTSEREMVARARAHRFSSGPDLGWLRSRIVGTRSGVASRGGFDRGSSSPDLGWLRSRGGFDHGAASIWGGFSSPTAPPSTTSSPTSLTASSGPDLGQQRERELRKRVERESRKRAEKESKGERAERVFSVNRFHFFCEGFSGQTEKIFS